MTTFVLVHGAFGSAAELRPVIPELEARGHRAIASEHAVFSLRPRELAAVLAG